MSSTVKTMLDDLGRAEGELENIKRKGKAYFHDLHMHFALVAHPDVIAEEYDDKLSHQAEWDLATSFKMRKCLLTKNTIYPFTKAYKGKLTYEGRSRIFWVSKEEYLFRSLKQEYIT